MLLSRLQSGSAKRTQVTEVLTSLDPTVAVPQGLSAWYRSASMLTQLRKQKDGKPFQYASPACIGNGCTYRTTALIPEQLLCNNVYALVLAPVTLLYLRHSMMDIAA